MHRRVAGLTLRSGRLLAISFALLLVSSVVVAPVVATGFSGGVQTPERPASTDSAFPPGVDAGLAQTDETNETHDTQTDDNQTEVPTLGEYTPRDVDGDGRYEDVTGDGALSQADISVFFQYQHRDVVKNHTEYFDYSGNGKVTQGDVVTLADAVATGARGQIDPRWPPDADRDGLPTAFEEDVTGTDPYAADSNSTQTAHNESGNDVSDADEDFSGNGLSATVAYEQGLDPFSNDTDDDGLPDTVELRYAGVNATVPDTDEDGTLDGAEDLDDDGLKNAAEVEHGTDLSAADTDGDGLDDGHEVDLGTDPLDRDSDDDGLTDAEELELDTDPIVADTDGDGTTDVNETLERTVEDEDTGVTVAVRGEGAVDAQISEQANAADEANITAAPTVRIQSESAFENATVTLPIDEDVGADSNVTIRKWDPSESGSWRTVPTNVDHQDGTATADVKSFSYVTVTVDDLWEDYFTETIALEDRHVAKRYRANASAGPGDRLWTSNRTVRSVRTSPTVVSETVFATGHDALYAINATTGAPLWDSPGVEMGIRAAPIVANGSVFVGSLNATVYSFDAETGDREWSQDLPADWLESAPTVSNGTMFVGPVDGGTLHAINTTDGTLDWTFEERSYAIESSPTVANGTVYVGTYYGNLTAVDAETGERKWTYEEIVDPVYSSPTVANGTVFVTADEALHAVDAVTGERIWTLDMPADRSSPTVEDGTVYIGAENGTLYAVSASTGREIWTFDRPSNRIRSSPTVANDTVYVGSDDGQFYAVNASTGRQQWVHDGTSERIRSSPTVANGTAYVGANGVHAIELAHDGTSEDSRVELGTFGHVGDRAGDEAGSLDVVPEDKYDPPLVLADTSRDGIPDAVADANPRIPVMTVLDPFGTRSSRIDIDPTVRDSTGDGLADARGVDVSYEVFEENGTVKLRTRVERSWHHPGSVDTDGDGLNDYRELYAYPHLSQWSPDTDGDGYSDAADPRPADPAAPAHTRDDLSVFDSATDVPKNAAKGAALGDLGRRFEVDGYGTTAYFAGWLAASILPVVDVVADTRDCFVPNSKLSMNLLDCGGAGFSALTSGGAILGAVSAPSGLGVGLASGSIAAGQIENVGDAVSITIAWVRHSPEKAVVAGRIIEEKIPTGTDEIIRRITSKLDGHSDTARALRLGANQRTLSRAGASDESAEALAGVLPRVGADADEIADLTNRLEDFDQLAGAEKQLVIRALDSSSESSRLADAYDGRTLERLVAAGSGGSRGDDVLSKADEAAQAGKAEDVAQLADNLDPFTLRYVLRTDAIESTRQLLDQGIDSKRIAYLADEGLNLVRHERTLDIVVQRFGERTISGADDVTEILANNRVRETYPGAESVKAEVEIVGDGEKLAEIDGAVVDADGGIISLVETKHTNKVSRLQKAEGQHRDTLNVLQNRRDEIVEITAAGGDTIPTAKMRPEYIEETLTVAPVSNSASFDVKLASSETEIQHVYDSFNSLY